MPIGVYIISNQMIDATIIKAVIKWLQSNMEYISTNALLSLLNGLFTSIINAFAFWLKFFICKQLEHVPERCVTNIMMLQW